MDVRRVVAAGSAIFIVGIGIASAIYFSGRPIRLADAVVSNFLSPGDNPHGYAAAAAGTAMAGLVLAPTALIFFRRMRAIHKWGAVTGTAFYGVGLLAAILIGGLAPMRGLDFSLHLVLAYAAFLSLQAGISVYLTVAAYGAKSRRLARFAGVEWILGVLLFCVSFGPDWPGSTAFCEWALLATIGAGLCVLAHWCSAR